MRLPRSRDAEQESESSYYGSWSKTKQDDWSDYEYALWIDDAGVFCTVVKQEVYVQ